MGESCFFTTDLCYQQKVQSVPETFQPKCKEFKNMYCSKMQKKKKTNHNYHVLELYCICPKKNRELF